MSFPQHPTMTRTRHPLARHRAGRLALVRLAIAALLALPLLTGAVGPGTRSVAADELSDARAQQAALARQIAAQKQQLANLASSAQAIQSQIASTKSSLDNVSANLAQVQGNISSMKAQIGKVEAKYNGLVQQLSGLETQLNGVEAQEAQKADQLRQRKELLAEQLRAAYDAGQESLIEQILTAHSFSDALSDVSYYIDMGNQSKVLAQQIERDQQTLAEIHQTVLQTRDATEQMRQATAAQNAVLQKELGDLNAAQQKLAALQQKIQAQLAAQRAAEANLARNQNALAAAIRSNGAAQSALASKIQQIVAAQAAASNLPPSSGPLSWPMGGVVTQWYGCTGFVSEPPVGSCAHFHQGIDIAAPYGTPVHAAAAGTVVFVGWNPYDAPPQAWMVVVAHSSGLQTWYAHMEGFAPAGVWVGAHVGRGQVIGYEGMTGHTTGPHLHWAVMANGYFVNPQAYL